MIKILCVGKIKEEYLKKLIEDYQNRITKYHKIIIVEGKDSDIKNEQDFYLKNIKDDEYLIGLDIKGKSLASEEFANTLDKIFNHHSLITFIIGGSLGLSPLIKDKCDLLLSFSSLTFPHGLFRGILLEQIYRAFKINNNESYHK